MGWEGRYMCVYQVGSWGGDERRTGGVGEGSGMGRGVAVREVRVGEVGEGRWMGWELVSCLWGGQWCV